MAGEGDKMAEVQADKPARYFNFVFEFKNNVIQVYKKQKEKTQYALGKVYEFFSPVINFFAFFYELFCSVFLGVRHVFDMIHASANCIIHYDYKHFIISLSQRPKEYFSYAKTRAYQIVCIPIKRRLYRVKKAARKKFLDVRVYFRGFRELCRRLFLLTCDYTPGGRWTVSILLLVAAIFLSVEIYRYSKVVFQLFDLLFSFIMFVLSPVIWTLKDLWKVAGFGLDFVLALFKHVLYLLWICVQGFFDFIFRVLSAFSSGIYRSLIWFLNLRLVKFFWKLLLDLALIGLEFFIFKVVPFLAIVFAHLVDFAAVLSTYFYNYFVAVYADKGSDEDYWSNTRIFAAVMTTFSFLLAYRYRKRFSIVVHLDKDSTPSARRKIRKSLRPINSEDGQDEVNFKLSSSACICLDFLRGECSKGRRCDNHHCPWSYHWQYRVPVQGWQSFSQQDCETIEKLFCNPVNEIAKTSDINPDLSAMTRRSHVKTNTPIRLDFQQMRMEVSYHRSEIRRLSTESTGKNSDEMATKWIWYKLTDEGEWADYGSKGMPKEEDIEKSFQRRESSFTYKKQGQEYRIYFFMTPMYERNMNPREHKRRFVRRRPLFRSLDDF